MTFLVGVYWAVHAAVQRRLDADEIAPAQTVAGDLSRRSEM